MIRRLALDQPGMHASEALERQVERLARVLRRSPAAVRHALQEAEADFKLDAAYADMVHTIRRARLEWQGLAHDLEHVIRLVSKRRPRA